MARRQKGMTRARSPVRAAARKGNMDDVSRETGLEHFIRITTPTTADRLSREVRGEPEPKQFFTVGPAREYPPGTFSNRLEPAEVRGLAGLFRFIGEMPLLQADWAHDVEREEIGDE